MPQKEIPNDVLQFRLRMRLSQSEISRLLGHRSTRMFSRLERGGVLPTLTTAFKVGIILRAPVEFLFPSLYKELKAQIRSLEAQKVEVQQQLPIPLSSS